MAIKVLCVCGKRFQVKDESAGKKVRCPACDESVRVPLAEEQGGVGEYGVEKTRKCAGCKREWPVETVVCVECGYNFETGKKMKTTYQVLNRTITTGVKWLGTYTNYIVQRSRHGDLDLIIEKKFLFIPAGRTVIDLAGYDEVWIDCTLGSGGEDPAPDVYYVDLEGRKKPVRIFSGGNEFAMRELVDTLQEVAKLEVKRK